MLTESPTLQMGTSQTSNETVYGIKWRLW